MVHVTWQNTWYNKFKDRDNPTLAGRGRQHAVPGEDPDTPFTAGGSKQGANQTASDAVLFVTETRWPWRAEPTSCGRGLTLLKGVMSEAAD